MLFTRFIICKFNIPMNNTIVASEGNQSKTTNNKLRISINEPKMSIKNIYKVSIYSDIQIKYFNRHLHTNKNEKQTCKLTD